MTTPYLLAKGNFEGSNLLYVLSEATPEGKIIIIILVIFSMFAWSVMISKFLSMRRAKKLNRFFDEGDILADAGGCAVGWFYSYRRYIKK